MNLESGCYRTDAHTALRYYQDALADCPPEVQAKVEYHKAVLRLMVARDATLVLAMSLVTAEWAVERMESQ